MAGSYEHGKAISAAVLQLETVQQQRSNMAANDPQIAQVDKMLNISKERVNKLLNEASGELSMINDQALAYRWQRSIADMARASRIGVEFEAYRLAPRYYRARQSLDTLIEGLKDRRKIIVSQPEDGGNRPIFRFDFKDPESALDTIINPSN